MEQTLHYCTEAVGGLHLILIFYLLNCGLLLLACLCLNNVQAWLGVPCRCQPLRPSLDLVPIAQLKMVHCSPLLWQERGQCE